MRQEEIKRWPVTEGISSDNG